MPIDESSGVKQAIVQVPLFASECYELPGFLGVEIADIHWITPVQVSAHYTGVPAPGFTFTIRPHRTQEGSGQWVDIWCNLNRVASIVIGGPFHRIVVGANMGEEVPASIIEAAHNVTVAFLVQIEDTHEDSSDA
jgi:hypothetical protein